MNEFFNLDKALEYTLLLKNATTAAKVGFFLEQHQAQLMVEGRYLKMPHDARGPCICITLLVI
jgi:hypothetical protein